MFRSEAATRGIRVAVESEYVPERSSPESGEYFFGYRVTITNESEETTQLLARHWIITDDHGHVEEVRGPGVVGEQPVLAPGESFEYSSACPLRSPCGTMHGSYRMQTSAGETFDAEIAPFALGKPQVIH